MQHNTFDFLVVAIYVSLVITFGTIAALLMREIVRLKPIDKRVTLIAWVLFIVSLAAALDSLYWALATSGRIGFLPDVVGLTLYKSQFSFIPKACLLASAFVLWYLLRKREIAKLGRETEEGRRIRILHHITNYTTQSLDLVKMLESAVPKTLELIGMEHAAIYVKDDTKGCLNLIGTFGNTDDMDIPQCLEAHSDPISNAAEVANPTLEDPKTIGKTKSWYSSTAYVPLTAREQRIGILVLRSAAPRIFSHKDIDLLVAVGSQLAVSIENAILFRENQCLLTEATKSANGLAKTVEERTQLLYEAQEQLGIAETHKRQFYKDTVLAVTGGKLVLLEPEELPEIGMMPVEVCELTYKEDIGRVRKVLKRIAADAGMSDGRIDNMILAAGEAMTNAIKHGHSGIVRIYKTSEMISMAIEDHGTGIDALTLPKATLLKGYSTKPSLGMGYALILELADKVYLCTGPSGTIVVIEMNLKEPGTELTMDIIPDTWGQF